MFLLFAGDTYYPRGGWGDYKGSFLTMEAALKFLVDNKFDWYQIVSDGEIVKSNEYW